jgi:hypothetical protein
MRRVNENGRVTVAGQRLRVGRTYAGQTVVIAIDATVFRVLLNNVELTTHARKPDLHIARSRPTPTAKRPEPQPHSRTVQHVLKHRASSMSWSKTVKDLVKRHTNLTFSWPRTSPS